MIKNILIVIVFLVSSSIGYSQDNDPVLFEIEGNEVHVSEFTYIYEKNNRDNADYSEQTLLEYLELYKKFKLKVQKAKEMKLDTVPALISELAGYRRQLAKSYLVDNEVSDKLVREVFDRQQKDRKISHIFFSVDKYAPPATIEKVRKDAMEVYQKIKSGENFKEMCEKHSQDDATNKKSGVLGYFSAPMPNGFYELETVSANLKQGEVSEPVRSKLGFHIVKLVQERKARGEMEISHIMIKKKMKGQTLVNAKRLIDSVYTKLDSGESFDALAKRYSMDKGTSSKGGYLGYFGINRYEPVFEKAAFEISEDGRFSKVIETKTGFHIIKRISKKDNSDFSLSKKRIKAKIIKDDRFEQAKKALIERIKTEANYKFDQYVLNSFVSKLDSKFYAYSWKSDIKSDKNLMSFGTDDQYSIQDFADFCRSQGSKRAKFSKKKPLKDAVNELLEEYIDDKAIAFEEKNLETKYPDFKSLMREYEEGILLFEATKINVWDKASKDSLGLAEFYDRQKSKYTWEDRAVVEEILIATKDEKLVNKVYKYAKKPKRTKEKLIKKFNKKTKLVEISTSVHERNATFLRSIEWKKGAKSKLAIDTKNNRSSFKRIIDFKLSKMKTLDEARGYVIADYQDELETIWVQKLKLAYPITVNNEVFKSLIK